MTIDPRDPDYVETYSDEEYDDLKALAYEEEWRESKNEPLYE